MFAQLVPLVVGSVLSSSALAPGVRPSPRAAAAHATRGQPHAARLSARQVVRNVQQHYRATKHIVAKFRQRYRNVAFSKTTQSDGRMYLKKPRKLRFDYYRKGNRKKSFVSNGKTLWLVEYDLKQLTKKDLRRNMLPIVVSFLTGQGDLTRDFVAKLDSSGSYGKSSDYVVRLVPRRPSSQYKWLTLVVDASDFRVKQSIVREPSGNRNRFEFFAPNTSKPIANTVFTVNPKAPEYRGFHVIDGN